MHSSLQRQRQNTLPTDHPPSLTVTALHPSEPAPELATITQQLKGFDPRLAAMELMITKLYHRGRGSLHPFNTPAPNPLTPTIAAITNRVSTRPGQHGVPFRPRKDTPQEPTLKRSRFTTVPRPILSTTFRPQDPTSHQRRAPPTTMAAPPPRPHTSHNPRPNQHAHSVIGLPEGGKAEVYSSE